MKSRYYVIFAVIGAVAIFPLISIVFYGAVPVGINYEYFENCEDCELYGCADNEIYHRDICMTLEAKEKSESIRVNENNVYSLPFGMTQEQLENEIFVEPIYVNNPNNPEELILDIDSMIQVQKILDKCDYIQKLESGEIPARNSDGSYNIIRGDLPFFNNGTHYIDSNDCEWIDSLEALMYHCFEANPMEQNWYSGPNYFDNGTHHIDRQECELIRK